MNSHIHKQPAGHFNVIRMRRTRITRGNLDQMGIPDSPRGHNLPNPAEVMVKPAVEADLQTYASRFHGRQRLAGLIHAHADRFLTENMLAVRRGLLDQRDMRIRRGADQHGIDIRMFQDIVAISRNHRNAALRGPGPQLVVGEQIADGRNFAPGMRSR